MTTDANDRSRATAEGPAPALLRHVVLAASLLLFHALRLTRRRLGVAVLYHAVGEPRGAGATVMRPISPALFERQLDLIRRGFRVVTASELPAAVAARRRGQRLPLAITFDDDLHSHHAAAAPLLEKRGLRATFYLCGASLERPFTFWWDRLQHAADAGILDDELLGPVATRARAARGRGLVGLQAANEAMIAASPTERDEVSTRIERVIGSEADRRCVGAEDVKDLVAHGMEVGFHTRRHDFLPTLDAEALERAMDDGREALERLAGPLTTIAYPHGGADQRVARAAREAGFACGFRVGGAALGAGDDPMLLPRVEAPLDSTPKLALMLVHALLRRWRG